MLLPKKTIGWRGPCPLNGGSLFNVGSGCRDDAPETCVFSGQVNGPFLAELNDEVLLQIMSPGEFGGKKRTKTEVFVALKRDVWLGCDIDFFSVETCVTVLLFEHDIHVYYLKALVCTYINIYRDLISGITQARKTWICRHRTAFLLRIGKKM